MRGWKVAATLVAINLPETCAELKALKKEQKDDATSGPEDDSKKVHDLQDELKDEKRSRLVQEAAATEAIRNVPDSRNSSWQRPGRGWRACSRSLLARKMKSRTSKRPLKNKEVEHLQFGWTRSRWTIAVLAALLGIFGLTGKDALVLSFHSFVGSLLTGLLLAGSVGFVVSNLFGEGTSWLDANAAITNGTGSYTCYFVWLLVTCTLAGLQFFFAFAQRYSTCFVDTLHLNAGGDITEQDCQQPLLGATTMEEPQVPLPPVPPPDVGWNMILTLNGGGMVDSLIALIRSAFVFFFAAV
eukprot:g1124.t1